MISWSLTGAIMATRSRHTSTGALVVFYEGKSKSWDRTLYMIIVLLSIPLGVLIVYDDALYVYTEDGVAQPWSETLPAIVIACFTSLGLSVSAYVHKSNSCNHGLYLPSSPAEYCMLQFLPSFVRSRLITADFQALSAVLMMFSLLTDNRMFLATLLCVVRSC